MDQKKRESCQATYFAAQSRLKLGEGLAILTRSDSATHHDDGSLTALAEDVAYGASELISEVFRAEGFAAPSQSWRPTEQEMSAPELAAFYGYLSRFLAVPQRMSVAEFEAIDLSPFHDYLVTVEPIENYSDFIYRDYGAHIADVRGLDMAGKRASDFGGHIALYFRTIYGAVALRKDWILTTHVPPRNIFAHRWRRLIIPVLDGDGIVQKFLAAVVPDNELRAGLDKLSNAVVITNERNEVVFANHVAQSTFGALHPGQQERKLSDYIVSDFAENLPEPGANEPMVIQFQGKSILSGTLIVHYTVIVSEISFRGQSYSMLMMIAADS